MISNTNKNIISITYNHLNLPTKILFGDTNSISYLYTALGHKVQKIVRTNNVPITTDYMNGYQYINSVLQFFPHAEGYVNASQNGTSYDFKYVFNFTDHLGNIRLSYAEDITSRNQLKVIEENHYYPFGLKHSGYNSDRMMYIREASVLKIKPVPPFIRTSYDYKFSGKEYQDELGLNMYDLGARGYMPDIGRTTTIDPHAYNYPWASPYNYAFNNPVLVIDPDGKDGIVTGSGTKDDPFRVRANYYYYGLSDKQAKGLNDAISSYNNNGEARSFKDADGNSTYVVMELTATEVADEDTAREMANSDYVQVGETTAYFGNIVKVGGESKDDHFGNATGYRINLNQEKITSFLADFPGGNEDSLIKGTLIHEIGHNLGASHGDPGNIMSNISLAEQSGSGVYNYRYPSINDSGIRAFMGRVNSPGSITSYYLTPEENEKVVSHSDNGAPGVIRKVN